MEFDNPTDRASAIAPQPLDVNRWQTQTRLLSVRETADFLGFSQTWVRRHEHELPAVRFGRVVRFDSSLLSQVIQSKIERGKSLKPERTIMHSRYQRGSVFQKGKKAKTWYGLYREDVRTPAGIERRQRKVRLGTLKELPTKNAARNKLAELMGDGSTPTVMDMTFQELAERWERAEGASMKVPTLAHYHQSLHACVLPLLGTRKLGTINREDIQRFLAERAKTYSRSSLRRMRTVISLSLRWASDCGWIETNPCVRIRLPLQVGGKSVKRTVLTPEQINAIAGKLEEPYATLVLFIAATGLRVSEAVAVKWSDFTDNVIAISRRIYAGDIGDVKTMRSVRRLPVDPKLIQRMRSLGKEHEYAFRKKALGEPNINDWVFRSKAGTPLNPGNVLKRYVRPVVKQLGISMGGWHDLRHTLSTTLRRANVHPKVISDILGHSKVNLAMDVYDRTNVKDFEEPLAMVSSNLLPNVTQTPAAE